MTSKTNPARPAAKRPHRERRQWSPRFLEGTDADQLGPAALPQSLSGSSEYWYIAGVVSVSSTMNLVLRWMQNGLYGDRIARTKIDYPPIFVIGHWRTGTTLLHELLVLRIRTSPIPISSLLQPEPFAHQRAVFQAICHVPGP